MTAVEIGTPGHRSGLEGVPAVGDDVTQTKKDFTSGSEVRWCPGCGDYAILAAIQGFMPELGIRRENVVCISGIGCAARLPYYLDTYGMHSIHGRAPAIATGLAASRPDLHVLVVTGDGDALSIGGNHLIHSLRRNVNLTILLFNNRIYGLTKGQYSPTSELGKVTKSTPAGSVDAPFNPVSLALGAGATFVARTLDSDRKHLTSVLRAAAAHRGTSLVEIYQNCPIFNDGAFDALKDRATAEQAIIPLVHGEPIRFGAEGRLAVVRTSGGNLEVVDLADNPGAESDVVVHDAHADDPSYAFALSRLNTPGTVTRAPIGVFRSVDRPAYDDLVRQQGITARAGELPTPDERPAPRSGISTAALESLIAGKDTWTVD